jgi:hypothetical protein
LGDVAALGIVAELYSIAALRSPLKEGLDLDKHSFTWPHPVHFGEVLFVVDDVAERAMRKVASQGHEEVEATLAEMCDAIAMVTQLGTEAQHQMAVEVVIRA